MALAAHPGAAMQGCALALLPDAGHSVDTRVALLEGDALSALACYACAAAKISCVRAVCKSDQTDESQGPGQLFSSYTLTHTVAASKTASKAVFRISECMSAHPQTNSSTS